MRLLLLLLVAMLMGGCAENLTANGPPVTPDGPTNPVAPAQATLVVRHTLLRAVPASVTHFRFTGRDATGNVVFGPPPVAKAAEIRLTVPVTLTQLTIEYLEGNALVGVFSAAVTLVAGSTVVIEDPNWSDVVTLTSIAVTPADPSIALGTTRQFTATGTFGGGVTQDVTTTVSWSSSDPAVALVDALGLASSVSVGSTSIRATLNGVTGSTTLTVTGAVLISLALDGPYTVAVGGTVQANLVGTFSDGSNQPVTGQATWTTNDPAVAAVSDANPTRGLIGGNTVGSTTVTASFSGQTASAPVSVTPPAALVADVIALDTSGANLLLFNSATPANLTVRPVTGVLAGDTLVGLDIRPQTNRLYGLGFNAGAGTVRLYALSPETGTATPVGITGAFVAANGITPVPIQGPDFGFDFNPAVDRIRVVTSAGQNFRINPNTGAFIDGDLDLGAAVPGVNQDGAINGGTTTADGAAYTNNRQSVTVTTLYALDAATDSIYVQNPPNAGTETLPTRVTLNGAPLDFTAVNGFDIAPGVDVTANNMPVTAGSAFALLQSGGASALYGIDLTNGQALLLGALPGAPRGLAVVPPGPGLPLIGLGNNALFRYNSAAAGSVNIAATGLVAGETLEGLDLRPATGQVYALGVNPANGTGSATLYRLDPQTGAATVVGTANGVANGAGTPISIAGAPRFGFDFNPTVDRIRLTTDNGL
ncbi:MAG: DUF4394 domain-containing protein, partial [Candidatus Eremiobacterota bacterium]